MKLFIAALIGVSVLVLAAVAGEPKTALKVGDAAPAFSLQGSDGELYDLAKLEGKKAVVVAWFPKAFTGG